MQCLANKRRPSIGVDFHRACCECSSLAIERPAGPAYIFVLLLKTCTGAWKTHRRSNIATSSVGNELTTESAEDRVEWIWFGSRVSLGNNAAITGCQWRRQTAGRWTLYVRPWHCGVRLQADTAARHGDSHRCRQFHQCHHRFRTISHPTTRESTRDLTATLASAFALSRLDYCNTMYLSICQIHHLITANN